MKKLSTGLSTGTAPRLGTSRQKRPTWSINRPSDPYGHEVRPQSFPGRSGRFGAIPCRFSLDQLYENANFHPKGVVHKVSKGKSTERTAGFGTPHSDIHNAHPQPVDNFAETPTPVDNSVRRPPSQRPERRSRGPRTVTAPRHSRTPGRGAPAPSREGCGPRRPRDLRDRTPGSAAHSEECRITPPHIPANHPFRPYYSSGPRKRSRPRADAPRIPVEPGTGAPVAWLCD